MNLFIVHSFPKSWGCTVVCSVYELGVYRLRVSVPVCVRACCAHNMRERLNWFWMLCIWSDAFSKAHTGTHTSTHNGTTPLVHDDMLNKTVDDTQKICVLAEPGSGQDPLRFISILIAAAPLRVHVYTKQLSSVANKTISHYWISRKTYVHLPRSSFSQPFYGKCDTRCVI